jgi:hypothetical protein
MGVNAAQASLATTDREYVESEMFRRYAGGVYFHWNFWCNVADPEQAAFCDNVIRTFQADLVEQHRERDQRYALYRLRRR